MASIDFVVPLSRKVITGGPWCVLQYASGLAELGHDVNVISAYPSSKPAWFDFKNGVKFNSKIKIDRPDSQSMACGGDRYGFIKKLVYKATQSTLSRMEPRLFDFELRRACLGSRIRRLLRGADVTIATSYETVFPVFLYSPKKSLYFAQHYEPLFWRELSHGEKSKREAIASYRIGIKIIANSTWLKRIIEKNNHNLKVDLCTNAINNEIFYPDKIHRPYQRNKNHIQIVSYGGRNAIWKGFREMAQAMAIVKNLRPEYTIDWKVYGDCLIPPDNSICPYNSVGALRPQLLADLYRESDILLSASWYESFPLFPLEAMACGLAVITTMTGTEDYARDGFNCVVVKPKSVESITHALLKLIDDEEFRNRISSEAVTTARMHCWKKSIYKFNEIISELISDQTNVVESAINEPSITNDIS